MHTRTNLHKTLAKIAFFFDFHYSFNKGINNKRKQRKNSIKAPLEPKLVTHFSVFLYVHFVTVLITKTNQI